MPTIVDRGTAASFAFTSSTSVVKFLYVIVSSDQDLPLSELELQRVDVAGL